MSGPAADHSSNSSSASTTTTTTNTDSYNSTVNRVNNVSNAGNFYLQYGDSAIASLGMASGGGTTASATSFLSGITVKQVLIGVALIIGGILLFKLSKK